jgi:TonB-dependent outer membrane receptor, SusC/RagA subfamily, signature region
MDRFLTNQFIKLMKQKKLKVLLFLLTILCFSQTSLSAQTISLKGVVVDTEGQPVTGAGVEVANRSGVGTITDQDGNFYLEDISPDAQIRVSFIGMASQQIDVLGRTFISIVMQEDSQFLESVVVTALGIKREEKALSYSVQEVKSDAVTAVKDANFINSLNGQVAGLAINKSASGVGGAARVIMRGAKSIEGSNNVLYVIDGIPVFNRVAGEDSGIMGDSKVASEGIADFNPEDVESISVLSGPSAAALYGSSAANGAIIITTKRGESGKAKLDITSSFEASRPFVMPRFQNTYGNKPGSYESWGDKLATPSTYDPAKDFLTTGINLINSATLSMGTDKNYTFLSMASTNASGVVPNNNYERYNVTINNTSKLLNDKLEINVAAQYIKQKDRNMVSQGEYFNPVVAAYLFPRGEAWEPMKTFEFWDPSRNINVQNWPLSEGKYGLQNPYWTAYRNINEKQQGSLHSFCILKVRYSRMDECYGTNQIRQVFYILSKEALCHYCRGLGKRHKRSF